MMRARMDRNPEFLDLGGPQHIYSLVEWTFTWLIIARTISKHLIYFMAAAKTLLYHWGALDRSREIPEFLQFL